MFSPKGLGHYWAVLIGGDFAIGVLAAYGGRLAVSPLEHHFPGPNQFSQLSLVLGLLWVGALYFQDLYVVDRSRSEFRIASSVLVAAVKLGIAIGVLVLIVPRLGLNLGRRFYLADISIAAVSLSAWHLIVSNIFANRINLGILVAGTGEGARLIAKEVLSRHHLGYKFLGFVEHRDYAPAAHKIRSVRGEPLYVVSSLDQIPGNGDVASLVVADRGAASFPVRDLMQWRLRGAEVIDLESFYERLTGKLPVPFLRESWLALSPGFVRSRWRQRLKRLVDLAAATTIMLLTFPIALIAAVAIKLDSGPIFYSQDRVGMDGTVFRVYKFRSMRDGAENATGPVWAANGDSRVTRVGRLIRRLRIDELPQLLNVLKGDMSLVGPRPERPELVAELARALPFYEYRHSVRPGLTGWAQICYPYGASVEDAQEKLCFDLYYVKNWSPTFDVQIMLQTFKVVVFGRGAR